MLSPATKNSGTLVSPAAAVKVPTPSIRPQKPQKLQKQPKQQQKQQNAQRQLQKQPRPQKQPAQTQQKQPAQTQQKQPRQQRSQSRGSKSTGGSATATRTSDREMHRVLAALHGDEDPQQQQLVQAYPFKAKSLQFRSQFDSLVGTSYVWVPRSPDTFHEMLGVMSQAVAFLGFEESAIASSHSAQYSAIECLAELAVGGGLNLRDKRLSLLWIRPPEYSWSQLHNFLVYRQADSQHEGIINKWLLIANLKDADRRFTYMTAGGGRFSSDQFLPQTISLDMPFSDLTSLLGTSGGTYIVKDVRGTKGQNISLLRLSSGPSGRQDLLKMLKSSRLQHHRLSDVILQKYIERPLLVDKRKFDFRVYMLMVNACRHETSAHKKAFFVYFHPGFLRLCIMAYQRDSGDLLCHLTNQHVQMGSILYDQYKEATVWKPDELNRYFNAKGGLPERDFVRDRVYPRIGAIVGYLGAAFADILRDGAIPANTFKVFGVDFMVDSGLSVQLLEVNELPSWKRQTKVLDRLKTDLWREAVALSVETVAKYRQDQPLEPLVSRCNFQLVHSSEQPQLLTDLIASQFA